MASGDTLITFLPNALEPPVAVPALPGIRNGIPILRFDDTVDWIAIFSAVLPNAYSAGGVDVEIYWAADAAIINNVKWNALWERRELDVTDMDSDSFATGKSVTTTTANAAGEVVRTTISFSNGAEMDNLVKNEMFRLKVFRDANAGGDTLIGDAHLVSVNLRES